MQLQPVSHRDLALVQSDSNHTKKVRMARPPFHFTAAQRKQIEKIRKTTYGKGRTKAINELAIEWDAPANAISYQIYRKGAFNRTQVEKYLAKRHVPEKVKRHTPSRVQRPVEREVPKGTTKLRFKITGLEIQGNEIVMHLKT